MSSGIFVIPQKSNVGQSCELPCRLLQFRQDGPRSVEAYLVIGVSIAILVIVAERAGAGRKGGSLRVVLRASVPIAPQFITFCSGTGEEGEEAH